MRRNLRFTVRALPALVLYTALPLGSDEIRYTTASWPVEGLGNHRANIRAEGRFGVDDGSCAILELRAMGTPGKEE